MEMLKGKGRARHEHTQRSSKKFVSRIKWGCEWKCWGGKGIRAINMHRETPRGSKQTEGGGRSSKKESFIANLPSQIFYVRFSMSNQSSSWILLPRACIADSPSQCLDPRSPLSDHPAQILHLRLIVCLCSSISDQPRISDHTSQTNHLSQMMQLGLFVSDHPSQSSVSNQSYISDELFI